MVTRISSQLSSIRFTRRVHPPGPSRPRGRAFARACRALRSSRRALWPPRRGATPEPMVWVTPEAFDEILRASPHPLIVCERRGWLIRRTHHVTQRGGFTFITRAPSGDLRFPPGSTVIGAERIEFR